mgnify:CR=1 FL=1
MRRLSTVMVSTTLHPPWLGLAVSESFVTHRFTIALSLGLAAFRMTLEPFVTLHSLFARCFT